MKKQPWDCVTKFQLTGKQADPQRLWNGDIQEGGGVQVEEFPGPQMMSAEGNLHLVDKHWEVKTNGNNKL